MRISRLVAAVAGLGLMLLGPSALAAQPSYPAQAPQLTVSATSIASGDSVTVTGTGFLAGSDATVTWSGLGALGGAARAFGTGAGGFHMGTKALTADSTGTVTTGVQLTSVGDHTITMAGTAADGTPVSLSTTVTVNAVAPAGAPLPHTGAPLLTYTAVGLALLLLGGLVVLAVRKRRRDAGSAAPAAAAPEHQPAHH
jgi:LPXTG-motif cell wall-anchored protein